MPTLQAFNARVTAAEAAAGPQTIPLMVQNLAYATVRPDAFSANLLSFQNGQVYDVPGRSQSPYLTRQLFAAAPTRSYSATGDVSFVLSRSLYIDHTGGGNSPSQVLPSMAIDFDDGRGYVPVDFDSPVAVTYITAGVKHIKVNSNRTRNTTISNFDIEIGASSSGDYRPTAGDYSIPFAPIAGVRAGGTAYVHLATNHNQLTKPLIVAEGFDMHFVAPLIQENNYSIEDFLREIDINSGFNFRNALENVGSYDIVFIDYDNGADDILLNAGLFEAVLTEVNRTKQGGEQNVVMGISMGGLIARYKLAEMTKAGRPTQTRLLILQDSPQRGANVPLGLQALIRQAGNLQFGFFSSADLSKKLQQALLLLDQPATRQLVLYNATGPQSGFFANTFVEGPYRSMITYPAPYQIIAVSQGSQCGNGLFAPYTELVRGDAKFFLSPSPWISRSTYYAQVIVNALPANGQANRISTLQVYGKLRLFGFINIRSDFTRQNYSCPAGLLALDGAPGGTEPVGDTPGGLNGSSNTSFLPFFQVKYGYSAVDKFSFIPTPSALDIADFNPTTQYGRYVNGTTSTSYSRVNDFLAQEQFSRGSGPFFNEAHTIFTVRNSEWIFNKMDGRPLASNYCSSECLGPLAIQSTCNGNSAVFTIPNLPAGTAVTWSAPSYLFTITTGSGTTFTTTVKAGASGTDFVTARVGPCNAVVSYRVVIGGTPPGGYYNSAGGQFRLNTYQSVAPGTQVTISLDQLANFTWTADADHYSIRFNSSYNSASFVLNPNMGVRITATAAGSACAGPTGSWVFTARSAYSYGFAPNPTSSELTVTAVDADEVDKSKASKNAPEFDADLYDTFGKKVKSKHAKKGEGKAVLDVHDLPNGLYNLRVGKGEEAIFKHIQITH